MSTIYFFLIGIVTQLIYAQCPDGEILVSGNCQSNDITELPIGFTYIGSNITFTFSWQFTDNDTVIMILTYNTPFYFSLAFGNTMSNAKDMWIFEVDKEQNNSIRALDCFGLNTNWVQNDVDNGGENNIVILGYQYYEKNITTVKFMRSLNTGIKSDIHDQVITQRLQPAMFAYGQWQQYTVNFHGPNDGIFQFEFKQDKTGQIIYERTNYFNIHMWLNRILLTFYFLVACWGIGSDIGIMMARYWRVKVYYLWAHTILMTLVILVSLAAEIIMLYSVNNIFATMFQQELKNQFHFALGFSLMILMVAQLLGGFLLRSKMIQDKKIINNLNYLKIMHQINGSLLYIVGKVNIIIGAYLTFNPKNSQDLLIILIICGIVLFRIGFEILYQTSQKLMAYIILLGGQRKVQKVKNSFDNEDQKLINLLDQMGIYEYLEILDNSVAIEEFSQKRWVIFNNDIIDLTNLFHPGGEFIWKQVEGREVCRFIFGAYALEDSTIKPFTHSYYALQLMKQNRIGSLHMIPLFTDGYKNDKGLYSLDNWPIWTLVSKEVINKQVSYFGFQLKDPNIKFQTFLTGIESMGRYFILKALNNDKISIRPYTMILCMTKCNQELRAQLIKFSAIELGITEKLGLSADKFKINEVHYHETYHELPLLIKKYESKTGFSQYIHELPLETEIGLQGPYGTSFGLAREDSGTFVIVAGGTGLFPFLDLLDFLLRKCIHDLLLEKKGRESANLFNKPLTEFQSYFTTGQYKFYLILSLRDKSELVCQDIYLTLAQLQDLLPAHKQNFELILKMRDSLNVQSSALKKIENGRFDEEFLRNYIPNIITVKRFLVCGPPELNRNVPLALKKIGVPQSKIYIV